MGVIKTAQAKEPVITIPISDTCMKYWKQVEKYFGEYTDQALFVFGKESRNCTVNIGDGENRNGTWDYCIAMINNEPSVQHNIDSCIRRAWEKFSPYKHWSQWYAVCTPQRVSKYPEYPEIKCK